jgi:hypothetical protein
MQKRLGVMVGWQPLGFGEDGMYVRLTVEFNTVPCGASRLGVEMSVLYSSVDWLAKTCTLLPSRLAWIDPHFVAQSTSLQRPALCCLIDWCGKTHTL